MPKECKECKYSKLCKGGVIDRRYLWNGNLNSKDPYCFVDDYNLLKKIEGIVLSEEKINSVHDGYLPTMFFKNRKEKDNEKI